MHRHLAVIAALALLLAGCGSETPEAQPPPASLPATTASPSSPAASPTPSAPATSAAPKPPAPAKASKNVRDCFDGECTLLLTKPVRIPLDAKKLHYPAMKVTAFSKKELTYTVTYPPGSGGGSETTFPIDGSGGFGFRDFPVIEVRLMLIAGKPALVLRRVAAG